MYYLSDKSFQNFISCSMRSFFKGEHHVTRVCDNNVLILMFSGVLRFTEDGSDIELCAGEYYIQRSGLYQEGRFASDEPVYFYIHFNGDFSEKSGLPLRGAFSQGEVMNDIRRLENLYFSSQSNFFAQNALLYDIFGILAAKPGCCESNAEIVREIESYIITHFCENTFSLHDIAKKFNFSDDYIIKLFRTEFSQTPHRYITKLRIKHAKQLMLSTERSLGDIAAECGYSEYSVFYKSFMREVGENPRLWRKNR